MKINKTLRDILCTSVLVTGLLAGCEYHWRQRVKNQPAPSEILPNNVDVNNITSGSYFGPGALPTELIFKTLDPRNHCEILFVDKGYNGSLDEVIIVNEVGRYTFTVDSPYFQEWNQIFLEYRRIRWGDE
jgi:hypothetical protein